MIHIGPPVLSENWYERDTSATRNRNRYLRGSTFRYGHGVPFTMITSPHIPDSLSRLNNGAPLVWNIMS